MITDLRERCPVCRGDHTYWAYTCSVNGDVWHCGSCGYQWTISIEEPSPATVRDNLGRRLRSSDHRASQRGERSSSSRNSGEAPG